VRNDSPIPEVNHIETSVAFDHMGMPGLPDLTTAW